MIPWIFQGFGTISGDYGEASTAASLLECEPKQVAASSRNDRKAQCFCSDGLFFCVAVTWIPKVMAFQALSWGFGPLFYMLLGCK